MSCGWLVNVFFSETFTFTSFFSFFNRRHWEELSLFMSLATRTIIISLGRVSTITVFLPFFQLRMQALQDKRTSNWWDTRLPRLQFGTNLHALCTACGFVAANHSIYQKCHVTSTLVNWTKRQTNSSLVISSLWLMTMSRITTYWHSTDLNIAWQVKSHGCLACSVVYCYHYRRKSDLLSY